MSANSWVNLCFRLKSWPLLRRVYRTKKPIGPKLDAIQISVWPAGVMLSLSFLGFVCSFFGRSLQCAQLLQRQRPASQLLLQVVSLLPLTSSHTTFPPFSGFQLPDFISFYSSVYPITLCPQILLCLTLLCSVIP